MSTNRWMQHKWGWEGQQWQFGSLRFNAWGDGQWMQKQVADEENVCLFVWTKMVNLARCGAESVLQDVRRLCYVLVKSEMLAIF